MECRFCHSYNAANTPPQSDSGVVKVARTQLASIHTLNRPSQSTLLWTSASSSGVAIAPSRLLVKRTRPCGSFSLRSTDLPDLPKQPELTVVRQRSSVCLYSAVRWM